MKRKALTILAGCPHGATELALALNGITRACLDRLVAAGLVRVAVETMANPKGMRVEFFHAKGETK